MGVKKNALVVVNYNDYNTVNNFISNVRLFPIIDLIVIVDNKSTDDSYRKLLKLESDKVKVITNDLNGGYGHGNNLGIKYIINKLGNCNIIVSNPDIEVNNTTINKLISDANENNKIAIVAPIIIEGKKNNRGWKIPNPIQDSLLNIAFVHRFLSKWILLYDKKVYNKEIVEVETVSGSFFLIKSKIIQNINYFDENLFLYYEENVLGKKIKEVGKHIYVDTTISVIHHHSVSIDNAYGKISKYKLLKNSQMYFQVNYNHANVIEKLILCLTSKISLYLLYVYYFIKNGGKK